MLYIADKDLTFWQHDKKTSRDYYDSTLEIKTQEKHAEEDREMSGH